MAEGFHGLSVALGSDSYWGAQVIIFPCLGRSVYRARSAAVESRYYLISGISPETAFFALHVVALDRTAWPGGTGNIIALHEVGSNNPDGR